MSILFTPRTQKKPEPTPDPMDILRNGWRADMTDDEIIDLQIEYFEKALPAPGDVVWTINNFSAPARAAYAHGAREQIPAFIKSRDSAFGRI